MEAPPAVSARLAQCQKCAPVSQSARRSPQSLPSPLPSRLLPRVGGGLHSASPASSSLGQGAARHSPLAISRLPRVGASVAAAVGESELDLVSRFSEIVPDTVVGDDFERFKPTAATVTSSLILGISSLPEAKYDAAIESALAYGKCLVDEANKFACFLDKALVNVGAELTKVVQGRVSTEVDPRLAHDTTAIVNKVRNLVRLYAEMGVPQSRVLFKVPATWQGIEAARQLEDDGIQTHVTGVNSLVQAAACAQAQVSVIQMQVGSVREWARKHSGDAEIDAAVEKGEEPGVYIVNKAFNFIAKHGHKTKVMASNIRSKEDVMELLGVDYLIVPLKVLEALQKSPAEPAAKYSVQRQVEAVTPAGGLTYSSDEMSSWTEERFEAALGPCARDLLASEVEGAVSQTNRVEKYFAKIWPPPNV